AKFGNNPFPWYDYSHLKRGTDIVSSTYVNPNHFAGYLEMVIPLALGLFLLDFRGGKLILLSYLTLILLTGLIISLSRGGWVSATAGLAFMAFALLISPFFEKKKLLLSGIGGAFLLSLIVLTNQAVVKEILTVTEGKEDTSLTSRVNVWGKTVDMTLERPVLGSGPGTFSTRFTQYQPPGIVGRYTMAHNDYLHFISETGLVLVPIIAWMIIVFYRKGFHKLKHPSRLVRGTTLGAMSGVTAILVHSIFDFNLHIPANALLFTVLTAMVVSPIPKHDERNWLQTRTLIDPYKPRA
ncbi:MAG: O-antigen ligase family protein, partial [Desulfatiglandaceae bacterium]